VAKEECKQAERERHRKIYKENPEAEKQRKKVGTGQETEYNVKLKMGSLREHLKSKKPTSKVENTHHHWKKQNANFAMRNSKYEVSGSIWNLRNLHQRLKIETR